MKQPSVPLYPKRKASGAVIFRIKQARVQDEKQRSGIRQADEKRGGGKAFLPARASGSAAPCGKQHNGRREYQYQRQARVEQACHAVKRVAVKQFEQKQKCKQGNRHGECGQREAAPYFPAGVHFDSPCFAAIFCAAGSRAAASGNGRRPAEGRGLQRTAGAG